MPSATSATTDSQAPLTLYIDPMSQPSRAVMMLCLEENVPHTLVQTHIAKGDQKKAPFYPEISRIGRVPVMTDTRTGFTCQESTTQLRYICATRKLPSHWYPAHDFEQQARINEVIDWHHTILRQGSVRLMQSKFLPSVMPGQKHLLTDPAMEQLFKQGRALYRDALKYLNDTLLAKTPFVAGSEVSIADLVTSTEIMQCGVVMDDISQYPKVTEWLERVRKTVKSFDQVHKVLFLVLARNQKKPYIAPPPAPAKSKSKL